MEKLLTLVVPAFNMEALLPRCLDSVLVRDERLRGLLDVVVVNDGSRDNTSAVGHRYAERHPDIIRVIDKSNGHYGSCINVGLSAATGRFIKALDADDTLDTDQLEKYLKFLDDLRTKGREDIDLIISGYQTENEEGGNVEKFLLPIKGNSIYTMDEFVSSVDVKGLIQPYVAYRTENLRRIEYRQTEGCVYTDSEWMFGPMRTVRNIAVFDGVLYRYLIGREGQSVSTSVISRNVRVHAKILKESIEIYRHFCDTVSPLCKTYWIAQLSRLYMLTAGGYFQLRPLFEIEKEFAPLDKVMAEVVPMARISGGEPYVIFSGRKNPFHYVSAWQKLPRGLRWSVIVFARLYTKVRRCVG